MSDIITPSKKIVILKPIDTSNLGGSSIIVASDDKDKPLVGEVVIVGGGKMPLVMKKGDIVAYRRFGDSKLMVKGQEYVFVGFADVLGIINK
jgi:chaperonin GroES